MDTFKVGDVCEIILSNLQPEYLGQECTVVGESPCCSGSLSILLQDGRNGCAPPFCLRKNKPPEHPREQTTTWDRCVWQPNRVTT
jgi:hypothetical protein